MMVKSHNRSRVSLYHRMTCLCAAEQLLKYRTGFFDLLTNLDGTIFAIFTLISWLWSAFLLVKPNREASIHVQVMFDTEFFIIQWREYAGNSFLKALLFLIYICGILYYRPNIIFLMLIFYWKSYRIIEAKVFTLKHRIGPGQSKSYSIHQISF